MPEEVAGNIDHVVVAGFGDEWTRFDQSPPQGDEYSRVFDAYFNIFPWEELPSDSSGFDLGCGSGRWARGVAYRVGRLHCVDASDRALEQRFTREELQQMMEDAGLEAVRYSETAPYWCAVGTKR